MDMDGCAACRLPDDGTDGSPDAAADDGTVTPSDGIADHGSGDGANASADSGAKFNGLRSPCNTERRQHHGQCEFSFQDPALVEVVTGER